MDKEIKGLKVEMEKLRETEFRSRSANNAVETAGPVLDSILFPTALVEGELQNLEEAELGRLPSEWKTANIFPIYMGGARTNANNYRPVSLTCICYKIMEAIVKKVTMKFLGQNHLLSDLQRGFRQNSSCLSSLMLSTEQWTREVDEDGRVDVIYTDFKRAFDSVPHKRLIYKLSEIGIRGRLLTCITDFLTVRSRTVCVEASRPTPTPVLSGVPQGSVLGPLLFLVYINDCVDDLGCSAVMFVDVVKQCRAIRYDADRYTLQDSLNRLNRWSARWLLNLNVEKCVVLKLRTKKTMMPKGKGEVSLSYDVDFCLDQALGSDSQNRLLWFARIRDNILQTSPNEIGQTIKPIIQRFRKEGSGNPQLAHWLLNILQMCVLHCTDKFVEELNRQDFLQPFSETLTLSKYIGRYNEVVRLKLFTLLKSWHELYKDIWPNCAFTKVYEAVHYGGEPSPLKPTNFHWLPNRNIVDENVDSSLYDLDKIAKELLERNNKSLSELRALCEEAERPGVKNTREIPGNLQNTAYEAAWRVDADLRFWEDIVKNADIPTESIQDIFTIGDKLRETKEAIRQNAERLKVAGNLASGRFGEDHTETQVRQGLRAGGVRSSERGFHQPAAGDLSSGRFGENHAVTQVRQGLRTGEVCTSEREFNQPSAGILSSDRVSVCHTVKQGPQGDARSLERGFDQPSAESLSSGRVGEGHVVTQATEGQVHIPQNRLDQPIPKHRSSLGGKVDNTFRKDASAAGFKDSPAGAFYANLEGNYEIAAGDLSSGRFGENHAVTQVRQGLETGEACISGREFDELASGILSFDWVGEGHAVTQGPQGESRSLEHGFDQAAAGNLSSDRVGECHAVTRGPQGEARSLERGFDQAAAGILSFDWVGEGHAVTRGPQGEARSLEHGFDQPAAGNLSSDRVGECHAVTRGPQGEARSLEHGFDQAAAGILSFDWVGEGHAVTRGPQGEARSLEHGFDQPAAGNLSSDRVGECHAVTRGPQGEARSLEHGFDQAFAGSLSSGRVSEGHAVTQCPEGEVRSLERGFDRPIPKSRSSLAAKADNSFREDAPAAGFKDRPAGAFDAKVEGDYEIIPKSRSSLGGKMDNKFREDASAAGFKAFDADLEGDYELITHRHPSRLVDDNNGSQMNASTTNHPVLPQNPAGQDQEPVQTDMSTSEVSASSGDRITNTLDPGVNPQTVRTYANWTCPICQIGFQAKQELIDHRSSWQHKREVAALPPLPADEQESNDGIFNRVTSWFRG
ncbi:hypothetical protein SprV_0501929300 [Sparganum proliferum]